MPETEVKLKPCPFCGEIPTWENAPTGGDDYTAHIMCENENCHVRPVLYDATEDEDADKWNKRA